MEALALMERFLLGPNDALVGFRDGSAPQQAFRSPNKSGEHMAARINVLGERHCAALIGKRALRFDLP
jgi:hypothetical protein